MTILIKDSLNNVIFSDPNSPSGRLSVTNVALALVARNVTASDGVALSGRATVVRTNNVVGTGNVKFRGQADVNIIPSCSGNIKAFIKGKADVSFLGAYEASGKIRTRGSAFSYVQADFEHSSEGGFFFNSNSVNPISSNYEYEFDDGLSFSGIAARVKISLKGVAFTSGVGLSGTSGDIVLLGFTPSTGHKISLSGQAGLSSSSYEYFPNICAVGLTGSASSSQGYYVDAGGVLSVGSNVGSSSSSVNAYTSVSFGLGGTAGVLVQDTFLKRFSWRIREKVSFEKKFAWGVGERPFSFYRVSGKCKPAQCPPIQVNGCPPDAKFTYVVNIYARNLSEVCRKLRERNMIFPIATIEKFSTPASKIDYTDETDTTCNRLVNVTPPITFLPCQDLLVDFNASANIGIDMKAVLVVAQYDGSGSLRYSGGEYPFDYRIYEPFGSIGVSGSAICVQKDYNYDSFGSIGFGGTVEDIAIPVWTYEANGKLTANLDVEPVSVVYPNWFMETSGRLGVSGEFSSSTAMSWKMSGKISTVNSTAFGVDDFLPYILNMSGGFGLSNQTDGSRGEYTYESFGAIGFFGLTHFLTPHITIEPSGRLRISNGVGSVPVTSSNLGIVAAFNGSASVVFTPEYGEAGRLRISGTADVGCSVVEPDGRMTFRGNALVTCSDLGEIAMPFAGEFSVKNETILFTYDTAPVATRPIKRIMTRCCTQSLPLRLWLQHPLANANHFKHFLRRNNLLIDNPVQMYYSQAEKSWYNTIHFEGFAPDFPTIELWSITFGWSCSDHILPDLPLSDSDLYYRFSMTTTLRSANNPAVPRRVSKIVIGFEPTRACFNNKTFSFPFIFNTGTKTSNPAAVQTLVCVDDIGLFKSYEFLKSPEIRFKVSEIVDDIPKAVVDIGSPLAASQRFGSDFGGKILSSLPTG